MTPAVYEWAKRNGVGFQALHELQAIFGLHGGHLMPEGVKGISEAAVASVVRLEASRKGVRLFRNNVGALPDRTGRIVRYGLANDSAAINKVLKSSDYIGWRPTLIEQHHVGTMIAQIVGRETKKVGWVYTGTEEEEAQLAFAMMGIADGGDFAFTTGEGTL